jgi:hypothetical protein
MDDNVSSKVRAYASELYVNEAKRLGRRRFSIRAGDVHKQLGFQNRVPLVCNALKSREFLQANDLRLVETSGPRSGLSTTVTYTYEVVGGDRPAGLLQHLTQIRGIGREVFQALGGGENFINQERKNFDVPPSGEHS